MQPIFTAQAPRPIGPYSQAVRAGDWVYVSGQIPLVPETGMLIAGGIREQAEQAFKNLQAVLDAAGADLARVVQTTVYLTEIRDFPEVNQVYAGYFRESYPARVVIQAAALPAGAAVEIAAVAWLGA